MAKNFAQLKDKQDSLLFGALDCLVLVKPYDGEVPESLTDAAGNFVAFDGFSSIGEFQKGNGLGLAFDRSVDGPEGHGSKGKRRYLVTEEGIQIKVTAQEQRLQTLGLVYDADMKELIETGKGNQEDGGFIVKKNRGARLTEWTVIVIGKDGDPGQEVYPVWIVPKMTMTTVGEVSVSDSNIIEYDLQFEGSDDPAYGSLYGFGFVGPGMTADTMALMAGSEGEPANGADEPVAGE